MICTVLTPKLAILKFLTVYFYLKYLKKCKIGNFLLLFKNSNAKMVMVSYFCT
jgi:hypothetical protein